MDRRLLVKLNEQFCLLLMMFTHNVNVRDLAFEYEDYDFMSHFKQTVKDENDKREKFTPREMVMEDDPLKIDENILKNHASLFPKIFNSMMTKTEKADLIVNKYPLSENIGPTKSIKLLNYDLSGFDTREMYDYLNHEDTTELP
jgi:hypothetical protein